jgi:hypothetical protein
MIDFIPICHLCEECIWAEGCVLTDAFPVWECSEFDDDYDGPDYPEGVPWQVHLEIAHYQLYGVT